MAKTSDIRAVQIADALPLNMEPADARAHVVQVDFGRVCLAKDDIGAVRSRCSDQDVGEAIAIHIAQASDVHAAVVCSYLTIDREAQCD